MQIIVKSGWIIDGIEVNGENFGGSSGEAANTINLAQNEVVTSISYNAPVGDFYGSLKVHCNLKIITNVSTYGPYASSTTHDDGTTQCDDGTSNLVTRNISGGRNGFLEFLRNKAQNDGGYISFIN